MNFIPKVGFEKTRFIIAGTGSLANQTASLKTG
jgi:hypothetical protein